MTNRQKRKHHLGARNMNETKPIETKVSIKPLFVQLIHHAPYEGPCRVGEKKYLTPEADKQRGEEQFDRFVKEIKENLSPDADLMDPVYIEWGDDFVIPERELKKLEPDIYDADLILVSNSREVLPQIVAASLPQYPAITIGHRYRRPVGMMGWVASVDITAYLRAQGLEGYAFLDFAHLNHFVSVLKVRKAIRRTKLLVALEGNIIPSGAVSSIWDLEGLKRRYGIDHTCVPAGDMINEMDHLSGKNLKESEELANRLIKNAEQVHMSREDVFQSVKFYVAAKNTMKRHESNAFVIPCFEICAKETMEKRRVTFCLTHTLLKSEGFPSACEGDINALMSMVLLMYISKKPAHMGNSYIVDREKNIIAVHHDVPGLNMKGIDDAPLPYELVNFTIGGWGATVRYDFSRDIGNPVTLARFDPTGTKLFLVRGEIVGCSGFSDVGCTLSAHIKVGDIVDLFHKEQDFGHHLALVYGDYVEHIKTLGKLMGFEITEA